MCACWWLGHRRAVRPAGLHVPGACCAGLQHPAACAPRSVASTDCFGAACTQCVSAAAISITRPHGAVCVHAGVALPTGLFVPSILCGAAYGRLVGVFVADLRPVTGSLSSIDEGTYALLGAASFLGGLPGLLACVFASNSCKPPLNTAASRVHQFVHRESATVNPRCQIPASAGLLPSPNGLAGLLPAGVLQGAACA